MLLREEATPRWIIFVFDIGICLFSLVLAYLLRFNFSIPVKETETFYYVFPIALGIRAMSFYLAKTYSGIIRYTSTRDAQRIFAVVSVGSIVFCVVNVLKYYFYDSRFLLPFSVVVIDYMATVFVMISLRIAVKVFYFELKNPTREKADVVIFGAGESSVITKRALDRDRGTKYRVTAFFDDNAKKTGNKIEGIGIYPSSELDNYLTEHEVEHVIISIQNVSPARKSDIIEICLKHDVKVLNVPPVSNWINGELSFRQIKKIKIEDLLGREPIQLDEENIRNQLNGKAVLITGAAGSIGKGLVRQISRFSPGKMLLLDQAESPLYELELGIQEKHNGELCEVIMGDVRNRERMENIFKTHQPEVIFHTAAYKHVPMMELNPAEAIRTNVLGTKILVDLAVENGVKKFVLVSTDKAVNPTNVMGASKRVAEIYAQSTNGLGKTKFITTRFGNVLGSNGSVIPLFRKQIEKGGPVTVTHKEVTRFFMTIPEACQLVLEAGAMGQGGEIFIFDMGKSVKIYDLAKKMIKLSRMELGKDIQVKFTGLRPGEKLYEELLADKENTTSTHHPQIMIARVREYDLESVTKDIDELLLLYARQDNEAIVKKIKDIVPEFISQNSVYAKLDSVKPDTA